MISQRTNELGIFLERICSAARSHPKVAALVERFAKAEPDDFSLFASWKQGTSPGASAVGALALPSPAAAPSVAVSGPKPDTTGPPFVSPASKASGGGAPDGVVVSAAAAATSAPPQLCPVCGRTFTPAPALSDAAVEGSSASTVAATGTSQQQHHQQQFCSRVCEKFASATGKVGFKVVIQDGVVLGLAKDSASGGSGAAAPGVSGAGPGRGASGSGAGASGGNADAGGRHSSGSGTGGTGGNIFSGWWGGSSSQAGDRDSGGKLGGRSGSGTLERKASAPAILPSSRRPASDFNRSHSAGAGTGAAAEGGGALGASDLADDDASSVLIADDPMGGVAHTSSAGLLLPGARRPKDSRVVLSRFAAPSVGTAGIPSLGGPSSLPPLAAAAAAAAAAQQLSMLDPSLRPPTLTVATGSSSVTQAIPSISAAGTTGADAGGGAAEVLHHSGLMWKQGGFRGGRKSWKCRSFELRGRSLYYYRTSRPMLLGTMALISAPPAEMLVAAAQVILGSGQVDIHSPEFAETLWDAVNGEHVRPEARNAFFPAVEEVQPEVAAANLSLPPELLRARDCPPDAWRAQGLRHGGPFVFVVHTNERSLFLGCESPGAYREWLDAIRTLVSNQQQRLLLLVRSALAPQMRRFGSPGLRPMVLEGLGPSPQLHAVDGVEEGAGSGSAISGTPASPTAAVRRSLRGLPLLSLDEAPTQFTGLAQPLPSTLTAGTLESSQSSTMNATEFATPARAAVPSRAMLAQAASAAASAVAARLQERAGGSRSSSLLAAGAAAVASPATTVAIGLTPGHDLGSPAWRMGGVALPDGLNTAHDGTHQSPQPRPLSMALSQQLAAITAGTAAATGSLPPLGAASWGAAHSGIVGSSSSSHGVGSAGGAGGGSSLAAAGGVFSGGVGGPGLAQLWQVSEDDVEVISSIGTGSYGEVYRGRLWGTDVAVKLLPQEAATPDTLESLQAEVAILSQLRHPNVVLYLGACIGPPSTFICLEWCERGSLHDLLHDPTIPISVANRLGMALQTARGMAYLHTPRLRIIHRDLKSKNLLVTRDFTIKVADFGLTIMRQKAGGAGGGRGGGGGSAKKVGSGAGKAGVAEQAPSTPRKDGADPPAGGEPAPVQSTRRQLASEHSRDGLRLHPTAPGSALRERGASDAASAAGDLLQILSSHHHHQQQLQQHHGFAGVPLAGVAAGGVAGVTTLTAADDSEDEAFGMHGTPQWMAPEVLENARYGAPVDIYSFGVVLCELTSRILPFSDTHTRFDFVEAVLEEGAIPTIPRWCGSLEPEGVDDGSKGSAEGFEGDEEGDEGAPAVRADGTPWGWREDLASMASLSAPGPDSGGVPQPLLGGVACAQREWAAVRGDAPLFLDVTAAATASGSGGSGGGTLTPSGSFLDLASPRAAAAMQASFRLTRPRRSTVDQAPPALPPRAGNGAGSSGGSGSAASSSLPPAPPAPVLGGVCEWRVPRGDCTGVLRGAIIACLSRDPEARPPFEDLVDLFSALLDRPPRELFLQLELPRLREAFAYGSDMAAAVAANEVVHTASHALFSCLVALPSGSSSAGPGSSSAARPVLRWDGRSLSGTSAAALDDAAAAANEAGETRPQTGLVPRFTPFSLAFYALLPFASTPSSVMSQMHSTPYVDVPTLVEGGPELLAGLAGRLRTNDLAFRLRLGLPLFCPDTATAAALGPAVGGLTVLRDGDLGVQGRSGAHVPGYAALLPDPPARARGSSVVAQGTGRPPLASPAPPLASPQPGVAAAPTGRPGGHAGRAAARAAAARAEEERRARRAAASASAHIVHALHVLLCVLDAASPAPTAVSDDSGEERGTVTGEGADARPLGASLPPTGSVDRLLMVQASRLVYPLATIVAANAFSPTETTFICRPTGGSCQYAYTVATSFPALPDFGTEAAATAAGLLRALWTRLPLLRCIIAHVVSATALNLAMALGTVQVTISSGSGSGTNRGAASRADRVAKLSASHAGSSTGDGVDSVTVAVPDDVVLARYLGVVLDRLTAELGAPEGSGAGGAAVAPGSRAPPPHPLAGAVQGRLSNASILRSDGVVLLGSIDVEPFDVTLC